MARLSEFVFCLAVVAARPQLPHLCVPSLHWPLGSVCADNSGRNAYSTSLLLRAAGGVGCNLVCLLLPPYLQRALD